MMRSIAAALAAVLLLAGQVSAQEPSPKTFVENIYQRYLGKNTPGLDLASRAALELYFTPSLADLIDKDAKEAEKLQEAPLLNGDPFVDAQDWEISDLMVSLQESAADRASAVASFNNLGKAVSVRLSLQLTPKGWRVDDIFWSEGSLRGLYRPPQ
jgi:hypothetical protein